MRVTAQYAEDHFPDVFQAAENGEEIVIARPGKPNLVLVSKPEPSSGSEASPRVPMRELLGVGEGLVHVPDEVEWRAIKKAMLAEMPDFSPIKSEAT